MACASCRGTDLLGKGAGLLGIARVSAQRALDRVPHLSGFAAGLGDTRLAHDMIGLDQQLRFAITFARRPVPGPVGRTGGDLPRSPVAELDVSARSEIGAIGGPMVTRIRHRAGAADLHQSPRDHPLTVALPRLWFRLSRAWVILRVAGVAIGKADCDGLHICAPPDGLTSVQTASLSVPNRACRIAASLDICPITGAPRSSAVSTSSTDARSSASPTDRQRPRAKFSA